MATTEIVNAVSPWTGRLLWVDVPRSGKSKKGNDWKSVDFVMEYKDPQGNDGKILFNVFGEENVEKVVSAKPGTMLKVLWRPSAREYKGKWFAKFDAYDITVYYADNRQTRLPEGSPSYGPQAPADDPGFPF